MIRATIISVLMLQALIALDATAGTEADPGAGWALVRMDLDIHILPGEERFRITGRGVLRCDEESSPGPSLALNSNDAVMKFVEIGGPGIDHTVFHDDDSDGYSQVARMELAGPASRGDRVEVEFSSVSEGRGYQIMADSDFAIASWTDGWYPHPVGDDDEDRSLSRRMSVPGTTTIRMPAGWHSLTEGRFQGRDETEDEVIERWVLDTAMARSIAAGPYTVGRHEFGDREIGVYLLTAEEANARAQAEALARAISAMESRFGPFPYPAYGIAEVPAGKVDWYAASQQGFIMANSSAFEGETGNLVLFAHEAAHAWWGNLVGTTGPGGILGAESLAQYGAVIALEETRGVDAATEFLRFSAKGYSPQQCAKGYFGIIRMRKDHPLSRLDQGGIHHQLSDSKGHWVYHMLRRRVGDEVFFSTLRGLIGEYRNRKMTLDDIRRAFIESAPPDAGLETFFEQWLDRTGAPVLDVDWSGSEDHGGPTVTGVIRQLQGDAPYHLDLDVVVSGSEGQKSHRIEIGERETPFVLPSPGEPRDVSLDPDHRLLIWTPEYGPRTDFEGTLAQGGKTDLSHEDGSGPSTPESKGQLPADGLVSDFEAGWAETSFGLGWTIVTDTFRGGHSSAEYALVDEAEHSGSAMRIDGELKEGASPTFGGVMFHPGDGPMEPRDLSRWTGLRFRASGDGQSYSIGLFSRALGSDPVMKVFRPAKEWQEFHFSFVDFEGMDGSDLMAVFFGASGFEGEFSLQIDDVRFE